MAPVEIEERRKEPRYPRILPIRFGTAFRTFTGTIEDISTDGIRIRSLDALPPKSEVMVFVLFPDQTVCLHARVVWVNEDDPQIGLALIPPQPTLVEDYERWRAEVEQAAAA